MKQNRSQVLIVGGGLAGLSCAVFLAWHGVQCVLIEQHPDLINQPRQRNLAPRALELFRQVGLQEAIDSASMDCTPPDEYGVIHAPTLASATYTSLTPPHDIAQHGATSPCERTLIDQDTLESLLRRRARELGVQVRFDTRLCGYTPVNDGVHALLCDGAGAQTAHHAQYLVAADGPASAIRRRDGITMQGPGNYFHLLTVLIDADLRPALAGRTVRMAYLDKPRAHTFLMALDRTGHRWVFGTSDRLDAPEPNADECVALVRGAAGMPAAPVRLRPQIAGTDITVLRFPVGAAVATAFRSERVFLVGDAAHQMPPTGGFGGATGVQDAHNLAWKLAAVLHGYGTDALLDSYHRERHPVARFTMQQAVRRFRQRFGPYPSHMDAMTDTTILDRDAVMMGYRYRSNAVIAAGFDDGHTPKQVFQLQGEPGTRAPHVPLTTELTGKSTLDLYGSGFVLLIGPHADTWRIAAQQLQISVAVYRFGVDIATNDAAMRHGIGPRGAILVRPDGIVAWRSVGPAYEPAQRLREVLDTILHGRTHS